MFGRIRKELQRSNVQKDRARIAMSGKIRSEFQCLKG